MPKTFFTVFYPYGLSRWPKLKSDCMLVKEQLKSYRMFSPASYLSFWDNGAFLKKSGFFFAQFDLRWPLVTSILNLVKNWPKCFRNNFWRAFWHTFRFFVMMPRSRVSRGERHPPPPACCGKSRQPAGHGLISRGQSLVDGIGKGHLGHSTPCILCILGSVDKVKTAPHFKQFVVTVETSIKININDHNVGITRSPCHTQRTISWP